ncbi:3'(2'),5'-bisphosphate nucleotidase CysQ, partial [Alphaproteobacteria bacterium]|nr:3'(2'),5'-bisphosphate nucleotidase CysQ [Alphaproteobacteria bacterium]
NDKIRQFEFYNEISVCLEQCSQKIIKIYESFDQNVEYKDDKSPLTRADLESHEHISDLLSSISNYPIISEEGNLKYTNEPKYWLVDPLDGTKEFINKNGEFTVNIALIENNYPIQGFVYVPKDKTLFFGGLNKGSFKLSYNNITEIFAKSPTDKLKIVTSRSHLNKTTRNFLSQFNDFDILQAGSSLKFCMIAEGLADLYPRLGPTSEWDTAAAQAVVEGAGGSVKDFSGVRLQYSKKKIINPHFIVRGKI